MIIVSEEEKVMVALNEVIDPELDLSIIELGLVYGLRFEDKPEGRHVEIDMTLTSPGCPVAPEIMAATHRAALSVEDIESVHVNLVWTPRWDPKIHAGEDAKMEMGIW